LVGLAAAAKLLPAEAAKGYRDDPASQRSATTSTGRMSRWLGRCVDAIWRNRLFRVLWDAIESLVANNGFELAGHMAFTALLALFPLLIFLAALSGLVGGENAANALIGFLIRFAPKTVADTLAPPIVDVLTHRQGGFLTFGLLFAIWAASSGVDAVRLTLNLAYRSKEQRPFWWLKLQSLLVVLASGGLVIVVALTILLGPLAWKVLHILFPLSIADQGLWILGRYVLAALLIFAITVLLHRCLPAQPPTLRQIVPGALATTLLWLAVAAMFTIYINDIAHYGSTYGTLAGIVVTLLFFDITALIFIFGAELNATLLRTASPAAAPRADAKPSRA
jgi:membrane protein